MINPDRLEILICVFKNESDPDEILEGTETVERLITFEILVQTSLRMDTLLLAYKWFPPNLYFFIRLHASELPDDYSLFIFH